MEELIRIKKQKYGGGTTSLPKIYPTDRYMKQVYHCENALKLCRAGARKTKFINFDLLYAQDENTIVPCKKSIKIPLLIFNRNKFSQYKKQNKESQHGNSFILKKKIDKDHTQRSQYSEQGRQLKFIINKESIQQNPHLFIT